MDLEMAEIKEFKCEIHEKENIFKICSQILCPNPLCCIICLLEDNCVHLDHKQFLLSIEDYLDYAAEECKDAKKLKINGEKPKNLKDYIDEKEDRINKFSEHIDNEIQKIEETINNIIKRVQKVCEEAKTNAIKALNEQLENFKANYDLFENRLKRFYDKEDKAEKHPSKNDLLKTINNMKYTSQLQELVNKIQLDAVYVQSKSDAVNVKPKSDAVNVQSKSNAVNVQSKSDAVNIQSKSDVVNVESKSDAVNVESKSDAVNVESKSDAVNVQSKSNADSRIKEIEINIKKLGSVIKSQNNIKPKLRFTDKKDADVNLVENISEFVKKTLTEEFTLLYTIEKTIDLIRKEGKISINSEILNQDDISFLITKTIPFYLSKFQRLYKLSDSNSISGKFHEGVSNNKPTLVIIKTQNDKRFGGYTDQDWVGSGKYKQSNSTFLFSLDEQEIYPIKEEGEANAIFCHENYGPVFGKGHDIFISNNCKESNDSYVNVDQTFDFKGKTNNQIAGAKNFAVKDLEVFQVATYLKNSFGIGLSI